MRFESLIQQAGGIEINKTIQEAKKRSRQLANKASGRVTKCAPSAKSLAKYQARLAALKLQADGDVFMTIGLQKSASLS